MEGTLSTGRPLWRGKKSDMLIDTESDTTEMVAESQFVQSPCDIKKGYILLRCASSGAN